ncbi:MAG TPA: M20 family metallopeptidase [Ktedonobacterales bacterium]|nr:M20 family metallopeptidase [Ktedonobacterales bacterium]
MPTTPDAERLTAYLAPRLETYLDELASLCAIECPTSSKHGVDEAGAWVRAWASARGWSVRGYPNATGGDGLGITLPGGAPDGTRFLLAAHLDTVYPTGTAATHPVRREGDRLFAPGSADNKSGLLSALYAMEALETCGLMENIGKITLACGGDEEVAGMRASTALLRELAREHDVALVLEAGRASGDIVSARKGIGAWVLEVAGRAAHAGVEPHKGASAVLALAQQVVALHLLNGMRPGVTVNVGTFMGGTAPNVVAAMARAEIDVRVARADDMEPVAAAIEQIAATPYVPGARTTLTGGWHLPPMARSPEIAALASQARACARELDFDLSDCATGGVSYANLLTGEGLPALDGLGPIGGSAHNADEEHVRVSSIVPRTALLALLMLRYGK